MLAQLARTLPVLQGALDAIAVFLTPQSVPAAAELLRGVGAAVQIGATDLPVGHLHLGLWRRAAMALAVEARPEATGYLFCDLDRAMHWAEAHPAELGAALGQIPAYDCLVFGRTPRAFESHPAAQRETEALANRVFALASGLPWDVMAAARGLSRAAAALIVAESRDDSVGSDCSWPLLCRAAGLRLGYRETEGMEFETLDRFTDDLAALGGAQGWIAAFDADPRQWLARLDLARAEIASTIAHSEI
jgi:hypothetical protein